MVVEVAAAAAVVEEEEEGEEDPARPPVAPETITIVATTVVTTEDMTVTTIGNIINPTGQERFYLILVINLGTFHILYSLVMRYITNLCLVFL